jgi:hypothetical protein
MNELLRPWKLATLLVGMTWLFYGATYLDMPDWDYGISIVMGLLAYITAPWSLSVVLNRRWKYLLVALFLAWFTIDGSYWLYWSIVDSSVLFMRIAQWPASTLLYLLAGVVWYPKLSASEILSQTLSNASEALSHLRK